jgi:NTP pyrophosphatase (non-canonical NTP hydrolase)
MIGLGTILDVISTELKDAEEKFPKFNSYHEGYAVLQEEVDELWDEIKSKNSTNQSMMSEAVQVAAMAIRFIKDLYIDFEKRAKEV